MFNTTMFPEHIFDSPYKNGVLTKSNDLVKNYKIKKGILSVPVTTKYEMITVYSSWSLYNKQIPLNWKFERFKDSIEELIEQFLHDQDGVLNWIEDQKDPETVFSNRFQIVKKEKIVLTQGATNEADEYLRTEYWVSNDVVLEGDKLADMIKAHPKYQALVDRATQIRTENEKIAEIIEREKTETIRSNAYETWKILEAKRIKGEFDEFVEN